MTSKLTNDQKEAVKKFSQWLEKDIMGEPFLLSGYAGSGKTFLAMKFLKLADKKKLCWTVAAPTHKAVGVLRKALKGEELRPIWYPSTIHRLLRLKLKRRADIELCEETKQTAHSLDDLSLVIIDEASMIDSTLLEIAIRCAYLSKTRLVFVGDPAQLPPVGEVVSPLFSMNNINVAHLDEVVRHHGPILKLATCIRNDVIPCVNPPCLSLIKTKQGSLASLDKKTWLNEAKSSLKTAFENNNPDKARILCYTNRVLEQLVPHARRAIHGEMADQLPVLPGEVLITRKPVMAASSIENVASGEEPDMLISSNREIIVIDITPESCDLRDLGLINQNDLSSPMIDTLIAKVRSEERVFSLRLLPQLGSKARKSLDVYLKRLGDIAKQADKNERKNFWRIFFSIRDAFASVGPASVLTVHRSQGSTFENVFVASDVFWPDNLPLRRQLAYVAVTRASKGVWLIGNDLDPDCKNIWENQFNTYL